jgi:hypothetical protein
LKLHDWDQIATKSVATIVEVYYQQMRQEPLLKSIFRACHGASLLFCAPFPLRQISIEENKSDGETALQSHSSCVFIDTGNYVSSGFLDFLEASNVESKKPKIVFRRQKLKTISFAYSNSFQCLSVYLQVVCFCALQIFYLFRALFTSDEMFVSRYVTAKHLKHEILPALLMRCSGEKVFSKLALVSDEANPLFRAWWLQQSDFERHMPKLVHLQHGIVLDNPNEWRHSLADSFLLIGGSAVKHVARLLGPERKSYIVGSYLTPFTDALSSIELTESRYCLVCLQPYVPQFGSHEDYLDLLGALNDIFTELPGMRFMVRPHPGQKETKFLNRKFKAPNVEIDNSQALSQQIYCCEIGLTFFSQTSYEFVAQGKPLVLVSTPNLEEVSKKFKDEFSGHFVGIDCLKLYLEGLDLKVERERSLNTFQQNDLSMVLLPMADTRMKIESALIEILQD